jgi:hypothetical protein
MAGEKPRVNPDSTGREVPFLKVTLDRSNVKTGKVEGLFPKKDRSILDENNSRRTYSGESHTDDKDSWISWPQAVAIASISIAAASGIAAHNTAPAPASNHNRTVATAEPFETPDQPAKFVLKGNEVNFMTDDGEIDVKKVDQQVTSGIAARFNEMHDPKKVDHYHYATDRSLIVSKTDEENGVDDSLIITTERGATPGHPGRETVTTTIYHVQWHEETDKTATLDRVVLVTPDMPEGAGEEQPFGKITSQGFRDLLKNPKTEVDMAKSYDPNADGSDQTTYMEIKRATSGQGKPTFITHEVSQSSNGSDHNYTWQPKKPEDASRVIRYWCL